MDSKVIYLDSHASTPVDQDVLASMLPYFTKYYGNGNHKAGWKTASAMEEARFQVANLLGARPTEIIFTSGATESINIGLLGLAKSNTSKKRHIITQKTEHAAVLNCLQSLRNEGYFITVLDVDSMGRINLNQLRNSINDDTLVVSIMLANNEIGTVQPIKEIGEICRNMGAKFFCDLTQGLGWHPIDVDILNIDMASVSSHKVYGPRGIGALYLRRLNPCVEVSPLTFGGGQERALRPGTANIPAIVGFGKACELLYDNSEEIFTHVRTLRDRLQEQIFNAIEGVKLNGCWDNRHPGNLNISIPGITGEDLIGALPNFVFSTSSACTSGSAKPSHVIEALGVDEVVMKGSFRFGICKYNTLAEIDYVAGSIIKTAKDLQNKRRVFLSK